MIEKSYVDKKLTFTLFLLVLGIASAIKISAVFADVPDVLGIEFWISGTETIPNITIRHASPTASHYVDVVEVDIDGAVHNVPFIPSQSTTTFVVQFNMGEITGVPMVKARAHCNFHGWSTWSEPIEVPEFSQVHLFLILMFVSLGVLLLKTKIKTVVQ